MSPPAPGRRHPSLTVTKVLGISRRASDETARIGPVRLAGDGSTLQQYLTSPWVNKDVTCGVNAASAILLDR